MLSQNWLKRGVTLFISVFFLIGVLSCASTKENSNSVSSTTKTEESTASKLVFNKDAYTVKTATVNGKTFEYRAYEGIVYVSNPVDTTYQVMNLYVPVEYFNKGTVNGWTAETAPIFLPNAVGGYMPGKPATPGQGMDGKDNAVLVALSRGFVVAAPGARGRTLKSSDGTYTGKAPAAIVDLKAAVRYLRKFDAEIPGNTERIISNGTSAGGALSALLGASGNVKEYDTYLKALGAADERDDIFAVSAYCPITNLENADMAYEWMFGSLKETSSSFMPGGMMGRNGPPPAGQDGQALPPLPEGAAPEGGATLPFGAPPSKSGPLSQQQLAWSAELSAMFPAYINSLGLKDAKGNPLTLNADGTGSFQEYVKSVVVASAQKALDAGVSLQDKTWVAISNGKVTSINWADYVAYCGRKKGVPAFDAVDLTSAENDLFGTVNRANSHFTAWAQSKDTKGGQMIEESVIRLMNATSWVNSKSATNSKYWRIRHGTKDSDTSLAISAILATKLTNAGYTVNYSAPWDVPHSGDYDLDELFTWIESICR